MGATPQNGPQRSRPQFTEEPQLASRYGAHSWRSEQSIIDILQNHLDANERNGVTTPPRISVQIAQASGKPRWIDIGELKETPATWAVTGFRVYDRGTGFDHGYLGVLGATTKEEDPKSRGGLGEGLKMCVANLLRQGAHVRIATTSQFGAWQAKALLREDTVVFEGTEAQHQNSKRPTGSCTEVTAPRNSPLAEVLSKALDTRTGNSVGDLVLDYRDSSIDVHADGHLPGIKGGRIYVKGLWICNDPSLLNSYNLGDRWAISGRDRKTVNESALNRAIQSYLGNITDPYEIWQLLSLAHQGQHYREVSLLNETMATKLTSPDIWRRTIKEFLRLEDRKLILVPSSIEAGQHNKLVQSQIRYLQTRSGQPLLSFIDAIFPGEILTLTALQKNDPTFNGVGIPVAPEYTHEIRKHLVVEAAPSAATTSPQSPEHIGTALAVRDSLREHLSRCPTVPKDILDRISTIPIVRAEEPPGSPRIRHEDRTIVITRQIEGQDRIVLLSLLLCLAVRSTTANIESQGLANELIRLQSSAYDGSIPRFAVEHTPLEQVIDAERARRSAEATRELEAGRKADALLRSATWTVEEVAAVTDTLCKMNLGFLPTCTGGDIGRVNGSRIAEKEIKGMSGLWLGFPLSGNEDRDSNRPTSQRQEYDSFSKVNLLSDPLIVGKLMSIDSITIIKQLGAERLAAERLAARRKITTYPFNPETCASVRVVTQGSPAKEYVITAENRDGELHTTIRADEYYSEFRGRGTVATPDFSATIGFGALELTGESFQATPHQTTDSPTDPEAPESDRHEGHSMICSSLALSYGSHNWDNPEKALIDCLQNHIDANNSTRPHLTFRVQTPEGLETCVSEAELKEMPPTVKIVEFSIGDNGEGFRSHHLAVMGDSTKSAEDRGRYGEGLKLILNACTRNGIEMQVASRNWVATPIVTNRSLRDYQDGSVKEYQLLAFSMNWLPDQRAGSLSTFTNRGSTSNEFWDQLVAAVDPRFVGEDGFGGIDKLFITEKPFIQVREVGVYKRTGIYEKRLRVAATWKDATYGYNFNTPLTTTRERTDFHQDAAMSKLRDAGDSLVLNPEYAREVAVRKVTGAWTPEVQSTIRARNHFQKAAMFVAFEELFGKKAVLSVGPQLNSLRRYLDDLLSQRTPFLSGHLSPPSLDTTQEIADIERQITLLGEAFVNEPHLAGMLNVVAAHYQGDFMEGGVRRTDQLPALFDQQEVTPPADVTLAAIRTIEAADQDVLRRIKLLKERGLLEYLVQHIEPRLESLQDEVARRTERDVTWRAPSWVYRGICREVGGYEYNTSLLASSSDLYATHTHELAHRMSGLPDYTQLFQQLLLLLGPETLVCPDTR
jgi:hypothetical protein